MYRVRHFGFALALIMAYSTGAVKAQTQNASASAPAQVPPPELEVAAIKPVDTPDPNNMRDTTRGRRLFVRNASVRDLVMMAYEVDPGQISGGPKWVANEEFDIDAEAIEGVDLDDHQAEETLLKEILSDRFRLAFHREQKTLPVYVMVVAQSGPKLKAADPNGAENSQCEHLGSCTFKKRTLSDFARFMQFVVLDRPVVDKTGIAGAFDFSLKWTPDESQFSRMGILARPADTSAAPPLFEAIQEQLGLKLEPQKTQAEVLVIDHVERPTEN